MDLVHACIMDHSTCIYYDHNTCMYYDHVHIHMHIHIHIGGPGGLQIPMLSQGASPPRPLNLNCAEQNPCRTWYMYYDHNTCIFYNRKRCPMNILHACSMTIVHASKMIIVHACIMIMYRYTYTCTYTLEGLTAPQTRILWSSYMHVLSSLGGYPGII